MVVAVAGLERALEQEPLAEPLYQHLMTCLDSLGRRSQALAVYEQCRKTLAGVRTTLSPDTESRYARLRAG